MKSAIFCVSILVLAACGGDKSHSEGASSAAATASAAPKPAMSASAGKKASPAASGSATPAASGSAAPGSSTALGYYAQIERDNAAKEKELEKRCDKFSNELAKLSKANPKKDIEQNAADLNKKLPAGVSKEDGETCAAFIVEGMKAAEYKMLASDILRSAMTAYEKSAGASAPSFCASAKPVPATLSDVASGRYKPKAGDFDEVGWKCLGVAQKLTKDGIVGQIESKSDAKSFEAIVRRPGPKPSDRPTEYVASAKVDSSGRVVMSTSVEAR